MRLSEGIGRGIKRLHRKEEGPIQNYSVQCSSSVDSMHARGKTTESIDFKGDIIYVVSLQCYSPNVHLVPLILFIERKEVHHFAIL